MNAYYKGQPVYGPRGPAGPDGNPVGTVISFMGTSAPEDYLVCDGAEYPIGDYPDLAEHFRQQFGAVGHFGGDGENTFAVPDLRNLFLRGYHGEAEEQLSGEVGEKQQATIHPNTFTWLNRDGSISAVPQASDLGRDNGNSVLNPDSITKGKWQGDIRSAITDISHATLIGEYTSRPVNAAILYCIKAVESIPEENVYSTEENRIGTWIDGKPLYQKTIKYTKTTD